MLRFQFGNYIDVYGSIEDNKIKYSTVTSCNKEQIAHCCLYSLIKNIIKQFANIFCVKNLLA